MIGGERTRCFWESTYYRDKEFTEIHMNYYKMLSAAMESLDHPYTAGIADGVKKKNVKKQ